MHAVISDSYSEFIMVNSEVLKTRDLQEMMCLDDGDRRAVLLKRINDAIKGKQAYLRVKWKEKQCD